MSAPATLIDIRRGAATIDLRELWRFRELLGFFAWRDIRVRYAQTVVGASWALLEPLISVIAFTLVFHHVAGLSAGQFPYPLFCFAAMLLWNFFARCLRDITGSFVNNAAVLRKIYFPRLILPCAVVVATSVDFLCASLMFMLLALFYSMNVSAGVLSLPLWVALAGMNALGIGLVLAAINVRYRDITQAIPFLIQIWMLATPVAYPLSAVPKTWLWVYQLNPMVGAVEGMRWALLDGYPFNFALVLPSAATGIALLAVGLIVFTRAQRGFADVI